MGLGSAGGGNVGGGSVGGGDAGGDDIDMRYKLSRDVQGVTGM